MGEKCLKMCLMTFNIICLFAGIVTFVGGLLLQFNPDVQNALKTMSESISDTNIGILSVLMLVIGGLISLIAIVGCCGVMSESKCMIGLYCIFLLLLLIGQLVIGGLGVYYGQSEITEQVEKQFKSMIDQRFEPTTRELLDSVQQLFECCGYSGPGDYPPWEPEKVTTTTGVVATTTPMVPSNATTGNATVAVAVPTTTVTTTTAPVTTQLANASASSTASVDHTVTEATTTSAGGNDTYYKGGWLDSCCKKDTNVTMCKDISLTKEQLKAYLYEQGCEEKISAFVKKYSLIIGAVALGFAALEILSIIAGCMLYKSLD